MGQKIQLILIHFLVFPIFGYDGAVILHCQFVDRPSTDNYNYAC
jgi:hypothetical protein